MGVKLVDLLEAFVTLGQTLENIVWNGLGWQMVAVEMLGK